MTEAAIVVGLGDLGISIARRLHAVGVAVIGVDGAAERRTMWEGESGREALASTADLDSASAPRAFVCVRTTDQAAAVIDDLNGRLGSGSTIYVVTTLAVDFARGLDTIVEIAPSRVTFRMSGTVAVNASVVACSIRITSLL